MGKRRVGERLRMEVRRRRWELIRALWPKLLLGTVVWFACFAALALLMAWWSGRDLAMIAVGCGLGAYMVLAASAFRFMDPSSVHAYAGLDGETFTFQELRRLRRYGWKSIPNLHFRDGDVDLVAVGPGGVVAIEAKSSTADWDFLVQQRVAMRWATQAKQGAFRVKALIKQHSGEVIESVPVVVGWVRELPREAVDLHGVMAIHGNGLRDYLRSLPVVLDAVQVEGIERGLTKAGGQFARAAGIERRALSWGSPRERGASMIGARRRASGGDRRGVPSA